MEELNRKNLLNCLLMVQKAAAIQNAKVDDPKAISEEEWAAFCMREGASRLADELIRRYGLDVSEN